MWCSIERSNKSISPIKISDSSIGHLLLRVFASKRGSCRHLQSCRVGQGKTSFSCRLCPHSSSNNNNKNNYNNNNNNHQNNNNQCRFPADTSCCLWERTNWRWNRLQCFPQAEKPRHRGKFNQTSWTGMPAGHLSKLKKFLVNHLNLLHAKTFTSLTGTSSTTS